MATYSSAKNTYSEQATEIEICYNGYNLVPNFSSKYIKH